jgi:hypothetical protein
MSIYKKVLTKQNSWSTADSNCLAMKIRVKKCAWGFSSKCTLVNMKSKAIKLPEVETVK